MTREQAVHLFLEKFLPLIQQLEEINGFGSNMDTILRNRVWNEFCEALLEEGEISLYEYKNWTSPKFCG